MLAWSLASVTGSAEGPTFLRDSALVPRPETPLLEDRIPALGACEYGGVDTSSPDSAKLGLEEVGGVAEARNGLGLALSPPPPIAPSMPAAWSSLPLPAALVLPPTQIRPLQV